MLYLLHLYGTKKDTHLTQDGMPLRLLLFNFYKDRNLSSAHEAVHKIKGGFIQFFRFSSFRLHIRLPKFSRLHRLCLHPGTAIGIYEYIMG